MSRRRKGQGKGWFVYQRQDHAQWVLRYLVDPDTNKWTDHRIPRDQAKTKIEAERYGSGFMATFEAKRAQLAAEAARSSGEMKIREIAKNWLQMRRDLARGDELAPSTVEGNEGIVNNHVLSEFGDRTLRELSPRGILSDLGTPAQKAIWTKGSQHRSQHRELVHPDDRGCDR